MKTIILTDEQYEFLMNMAKEMMTQNNRITENPLFCVYEKKKIDCAEDCGDGWCWVGGNLESPVYDDEVQKYIEEYIEDNGIKGDISAEDIFVEKLGARKASYRNKEMPVEMQVYFTEKAAQAHIDANHYHYSNPFIYVVGAWRNLEMKTLMEIVLSLAGKRDCYRNGRD